MLVEICASSIQSSINAERAGADRIELCSELALGGITPSYGLVWQAVKQLTIPVFVLIRPRSGNFTYTAQELEIMKTDIAKYKAIGVSGIVSGVLQNNNTIDIESTKALLNASSPLPFTFHRAFDWVDEPLQALEQLMEINVTRVLTSGQKLKAPEGVDLLVALQNKAKDDIIILPGGGINPKNVSFFKQLRFKEIHCSAIGKIQPVLNHKLTFNSEALFNANVVPHSDLDTIKAIVAKVKC